MKTENLSFTLNGGEIPYIPNCPKRNEAKDTQKIEFNELSHFLHFEDKINNKPSPTLISSSQHSIIKNQQAKISICRMILIFQIQATIKLMRQTKLQI